MAATSVKMDAHTKSQLENLQAEIKLATGRKVTQQELLAALVHRAYVSLDELIEHFQPKPPALTEEEVELVLSGTSDWGFDTSSEEIDEILYGYEGVDEF